MLDADRDSGFGIRDSGCEMRVAGRDLAAIWMLVGQRHFHGASTRERVPLLAVVNERTTRFWRVHNRKQ